MRLFPIPYIVGILALWCGLAWPTETASRRDSMASGPGAVLERALPKDAFREFLLENRAREDSLHYEEGEVALGREEFDLALSHHLAADLPADGSFRDELLAQRSRIFARLWPSAAPSGFEGNAGPDGTPDPRRPAFEWGAGAGHIRGMSRTGPLIPYASDGAGAETGDMRYNAYARRSWPVSLMDENLDLAFSLSADRFGRGGASAYEAALEAKIPDGIAAGLSLSFSAGLGKTREWGSGRYYDMLAAKTWYLKGADAQVEAGYSGEWDGGWKRSEDNAWAKASRDFAIPDGKSIGVSFEVTATRQGSQADRYAVPVLYVDDVARARPSLYQGPDSRDTLPGGQNGFARFPAAVGEKLLALDAPRSYYSFSPSISYAFPMPAGLQARAGAWYALDLYPEYAWERIPWPDTLDPLSGDMAGLALNRADGRYYPAVLVERDGGYRQYYGALPLEQGKSRRVDNRTGLDIKLWKDLPHGYFLSAESSAELGWTNLAGTAPATFRPWQWALSLNVGHSSIW